MGSCVSTQDLRLQLQIASEIERQLAEDRLKELTTIKLLLLG